MKYTLLKEVVCLLENFGSQHPEEAQLVFQKPLRWHTSLVATDFIKEYNFSDTSVQSSERDSDGRPLLELSPPTVSVLSLGQLSKLVRLAGRKSLDEIRTCLRENRDTMLKILGKSLASVTNPEDVQSLVERVSGQDVIMDPEVNVKLFLLLHSQDQTLTKLVEVVSHKVGPDSTAAKNEVKLLKRFSGKGEEKLLRSLKYTSEQTYPNGCRCSPWRQLLGEVCDLVVEPCDGDALHVTCTSSGVFLNKGIIKDDPKSGYKQTNITYDSLVTLLKGKSPHFARSIKKQHLDKHAYDTVRLHQMLYRSDMRKYEPNLKWSNLRAGGKERERKGSQSPEEDKCMAGVGARSKVKADAHAPSSVGSILTTKIESSSESEEEEEQLEQRPEIISEMPAEYWQIQSLVKSLKGGNQTGTVLCLIHIMDFNLMQESCQLALLEAGGVQILVNLLDTDQTRCKIGSLKILRKICQNVQVRRAIVDMGALQTIVSLLESPVKDLKALAAETIANMAKFHKARRTVRQHGGIERLAKLLDYVPQSANLTAEQEKDMEVARCGALALWSCSKSAKNKEAIRRAGGIPLLGRLLKSPHVNMLIPVVGTLQECASEKKYRLAIQTEGMIKDLVKNLRSDNDELQMHCANTIFKCAEDKQTRDLVRQHNGLQRLVSLLDKASNKELLAAAVGAIWKCSISIENVIMFQEFMSVETLVGLLTNQPEEVLVNVAGALGEFLQVRENRVAIRTCDGIRPLVNLFTGTNQALLVNVAKAVGVCATDKPNMTIIDQLNGVSLMWSLLKNPNPDVQSSAAWALCPCIENAKDSGEMRSFVGGLDLMVNLLTSTNNEVLASICAAIAKIAKDKENLAVLTDHGVVPLLARLTDTTDNRLRRYFSEAIGQCSMSASNRVAFGEAVAPLVGYLKSKDSAVHQTTVIALYELSKDPNNCITMYDKGVVKPLIQIMGSDEKEVQEAAAGCIRNIRMLALANRKACALSKPSNRTK